MKMRVLEHYKGSIVKDLVALKGLHMNHKSIMEPRN